MTENVGAGSFRSPGLVFRNRPTQIAKTHPKAKQRGGLFLIKQLELQELNQTVQRFADLLCSFIHFCRVGGVCGHGVAEIVIGHFVGGEEVDVGVGNIESCDDVATSRGVECSADCIFR